MLKSPFELKIKKVNPLFKYDNPDETQQDLKKKFDRLTKNEMECKADNDDDISLNDLKITNVDTNTNDSDSECSSSCNIKIDKKIRNIYISDVKNLTIVYKS